MNMMDILEELCKLPGVSGNETAVADYIKDKLSKLDGVTFRTDNLGNIIADKKGEKRAKKKLMLSAHMDEVGFIINTVTDEGMLKFSPVGGIDPRVVLGRRVKIGDKGTVGVIGTKAVHLQDADERKTAPDFDKLLIDIGANSKEDATKYVCPGDVAVFDSDPVSFGDGFIKARAIDDRVGCAIILELLSRPMPYDFTACFVVQEEVGLRGSTTAAFSVAPDVAIVLEATTAADIAFVPKEKKVCFLGKGPVISFMDNRTVYNRKLYDIALETAKEKGIPAQAKLAVAGGNDAGAIHVSRSGVMTIAVSLACRYLHSPSCVIKKSDADDTLALVNELCAKFADLDLC